LENTSRYLIEFQKQKLDDVEVPGQYLWNKDANDNKEFTKIDRFLPSVDIVRKVKTSFFLFFFFSYSLLIFQ